MTDEQINLVTNGNAAAAEFLRVFVAHCHLLDDVIDRDKEPVTDERLIASEIQWLLALAGNPFFQQHKAMLTALIVQSFNAWLDSNWLAKAPILKTRIASDVLKGFYHEVVWHTAFLCGGWEHLRRITRSFRAWDWDVLGEEPAEAGITSEGGS